MKGSREVEEVEQEVIVIQEVPYYYVHTISGTNCGIRWDTWYHNYVEFVN